MITDGWVLPDKEMSFDPRFDLKGCLAAFHSFLRNYSIAGKPFDIFMRDTCKQHNVNIRVVLPFLQMGGGLLSRKQEPNNGILRRAVLLPDRFLKNGNQFDAQLVNVVTEFRRYYENADLVEPFQLRDGVVLAKSRASYAVFAYIGILGQPGYPDSGCHLYMRHFNQLGRFKNFYVS
jgi:hypothetical protein